MSLNIEKRYKGTVRSSQDVTNAKNDFVNTVFSKVDSYDSFEITGFSVSTASSIEEICLKDKDENTLEEIVLEMYEENGEIVLNSESVK